MFTRSKKLGRLFSVLMVAVLLVSVLCVGAFAATGEFTGNTVTITKTLTKDTNAYAPATSFSFTVATGDAGTYNDGTNEYVVYAGVGTPTVGNPITFTPAASDIGQTALTGTTTISFANVTFQAPGIYHYTVTETAGSYDGITYDTTTKDLYVYVVNGTNGLEIEGAVLRDTTGKSDGFTNAYATGDLTITKTVTGNQGDKNKDFSFTVKVDGAAGEQYKIVVNNGTAAVLTSGTETTITLQHGQSAVIYGLSANDAYTVTETNYSSDGYTTTITGADTSNGLVATGKGADTITYTNDKNVGTPTGVLMNIAPYAIMIVLAGVCAVLFLRKKNHEA